MPQHLAPNILSSSKNKFSKENVQWGHTREARYSNAKETFKKCNEISGRVKGGRTLGKL